MPLAPQPSQPLVRRKRGTKEPSARHVRGGIRDKPQERRRHDLRLDHLGLIEARCGHHRRVRYPARNQDVNGHSGAVQVFRHDRAERLELRVAPGQRGPQVTEVISVDRSTAAPPRPPLKGFRSPSERQPLEASVQEMGTVNGTTPPRGSVSSFGTAAGRRSSSTPLLLRGPAS